MEHDIDLFEDYESLPEKIQNILAKFWDKGGGCYNNCRALVEELEKVGYTCEYGLDAEPYGLKKIQL